MGAASLNSFLNLQAALIPMPKFVGTKYEN